MKAIRWLLKLVLAMITLPLILAVWLIKWFVVFLRFILFSERLVFLSYNDGYGSVSESVALPDIINFSAYSVK